MAAASIKVWAVAVVEVASDADEAKVGDEIGRDSLVIPTHLSITEAKTWAAIYTQMCRGIQNLLSLHARMMVRFDFCLHRNASPINGSQEACGRQYYSEAEDVYYIGAMTSARKLHEVARTSR